MPLHFSGKGGECLETCPQHYYAVTFQDCGSCCQACDVLVWLLYLGDCSYENKTNRLIMYKYFAVFPLMSCCGWLGGELTGRVLWPQWCVSLALESVTLQTCFDPAHSTLSILQKHPVLPSGVRLYRVTTFGSQLNVPPPLLRQSSPQLTGC